MHDLSSKRIQPFNIWPRRIIQVSSRTDQDVGRILNRLASDEILHGNVPLRGCVIPSASLDFVGELDEAIGGVLLRNAFEVLLDFGCGCVERGPIEIWFEGELV